MWTDPEAFDKKVTEYFDIEKVPTWTGLALYMGFESRQSLYEYGKKEAFSLPVKKALAKIEALYEKRMIESKNAAGPIFALKNFGWKDKQEHEQSGGITIRYEDPGSYAYPSPDKGGDGIPESL